MQLRGRQVGAENFPQVTGTYGIVVGAYGAAANVAEHSPKSLQHPGASVNRGGATYAYIYPSLPLGHTCGYEFSKSIGCGMPRVGWRVAKHGQPYDGRAVNGANSFILIILYRDRLHQGVVPFAGGRLQMHFFGYHGCCAFAAVGHGIKVHYSRGKGFGYGASNLSGNLSGRQCPFEFVGSNGHHMGCESRFRQVA